MIEGFILVSELLVFGLLLWNVRHFEGRSRESLDLFAMKESGELDDEIEPKGPHA